MNCPHRPLTGDLSCTLPAGHDGLHRNYQGIQYRSAAELQAEATCGEPCPQYPVACTELAGHAPADHRHIGLSGRYEWPIAPGRHRADMPPATDGPSPTLEACPAAHPRFDARCDLLAGHAIPHRSNRAGITWTGGPAASETILEAVKRAEATTLAALFDNPPPDLATAQEWQTDRLDTIARLSDAYGREKTAFRKLNVQLAEARDELAAATATDADTFRPYGNTWQTRARRLTAELAEVRRQRDTAQDTAERRGEYLDTLEARLNRALNALEGRDEDTDDDELVTAPCTSSFNAGDQVALCELDDGHKGIHRASDLAWA